MEAPVVLTSLLSWLFSISGVTSFIRLLPQKSAVEKKLTFKPAIKTKNVKSLILKAPPARPPLRESDSWSMRITLGGNLISLISQTEHVRYLAAIPKSACSGMYIVSDYSKIPDFYTLNFKIHSSVPSLGFYSLTSENGQTSNLCMIC